LVFKFLTARYDNITNLSVIYINVETRRIFVHDGAEFKGILSSNVMFWESFHYIEKDTYKRIREILEKE
jgi:hypothetical protein